jgi:hypothetical protein
MDKIFKLILEKLELLLFTNKVKIIREWGSGVEIAFKTAMNNYQFSTN